MKILLGEDYVAVPSNHVDMVKSALNMAYGVKTVEKDGYIYLFPTTKSGVLPEYREFVKQVLMGMGYSEERAQWLAEHNQIQLITIAALLAGVAYFVYYYREQLSDYFWKVLLPILTFGVGAYVSYKAFSR